MKKFKALSVLALLILSVLAIAIPVHADTVPVDITDVEVNGNSVFDYTTSDNPKVVKFGDKVNVEVSLKANGDEDHLVVEATLLGNDHDAEKTIEYTDAFSMSEGDNDVVELELEVSKRMDAGKYRLRIEVYNRDDDLVKKDFYLHVKPTRNNVDIKDVILSPANEVRAGYTLITNVKVKNYGLFDEEDVKVTVSIPELGAAATDSVYISEIEAGDSKTSEDLWFRIPLTAQNGDYDVLVEVKYDDGDEETSETHSIKIVEGKTTEEAGKTIIAVNQEAQNMAAGGDAVVYPLTISNTGDTSKTYTVSANVGDWGTAQVTPNMLVLQPGETKIVYVSVAANEDATAGAQVFGVTVSVGDKSEELTMNANILAAEKSFKNGLEIALIVLVVILIIVALIVGFSRLKKSDEDEEEQTYY